MELEKADVQLALEEAEVRQQQGWMWELRGSGPGVGQGEPGASQGSQGQDRGAREARILLFAFVKCKVSVLLVLHQRAQTCRGKRVNIWAISLFIG